MSGGPQKIAAILCGKKHRFCSVCCTFDFYLTVWVGIGKVLILALQIPRAKTVPNGRVVYDQCESCDIRNINVKELSKLPTKNPTSKMFKIKVSCGRVHPWTLPTKSFQSHLLRSQETDGGDLQEVWSNAKINQKMKVVRRSG